MDNRKKKERHLDLVIVNKNIYRLPVTDKNENSRTGDLAKRSKNE